MKNKGMFLTICLIIVAGVMITFYTSRATKHSADMAAGSPQMEAAAVPETSGRQAAATEAAKAGAPKMDEAHDEANDLPEEEGAREETGMQEAKQEPDESPAAAKTESAQVMISPLSGSMESLTPAGDQAAVQETVADYRERLEEIDSQIKKVRTENTDSNTYSVKNTADYEFRLWDTVLNEMYTVIMDQMSDEEKEKLKTEEREWMRKRDTAAREAANKYNGGVLEGVEYTASMAASTRERAYELAEEFSAMLGTE